MTILNVVGWWCNVDGYTILIGGWSEIKAGQQNYVTQGENGSLKVVGFAFLIGISEQKHGKDHTNDIPTREDKTT